MTPRLISLKGHFLKTGPVKAPTPPLSGLVYLDSAYSLFSCIVESFHDSKNYKQDMMSSTSSKNSVEDAYNPTEKMKQVLFYKIQFYNTDPRAQKSIQILLPVERARC